MEHQQLTMNTVEMMVEAEGCRGGLAMCTQSGRWCSRAARRHQLVAGEVSDLTCVRMARARSRGS
jgi:hypothetical protein